MSWDLGTHTHTHTYINIQVEFHLIQNLNPIGINISNQFVCCYLINPIKGGLKKKGHMNRKKKENIFLCKKGNFSFINQKKKKKIR